MNLPGSILLGCTPEDTKPVEPKQSNQDQWRTLPRHSDEDQVQLDVHRAFVYYPKGLRYLPFDTRGNTGLNAVR